tara:strand:- start:10181 stop:10348 length:168 start_codon:yes stop_codon:yes gene_type:complete
MERDVTTRRALAMEAFARLSDAEKVDFVRWVLGDLSFLTGEDMAKLVKEVILDGT